MRPIFLLFRLCLRWTRFHTLDNDQRTTIREKKDPYLLSRARNNHLLNVKMMIISITTHKTYKHACIHTFISCIHTTGMYGFTPNEGKKSHNFTYDIAQKAAKKKRKIKMAILGLAFNPISHSKRASNKKTWFRLTIFSRTGKGTGRLPPTTNLPMKKQITLIYTLYTDQFH